MYTLNKSSSETPRKAQHWFCYNYLSTYPCYPKPQKCCFSAVLEPNWNCRHSVFLKKAQPWLSVLDVFMGVLEQIESTALRGGRGWYCWITCQKWSGSEMKGEGSKGRLENIWGGKTKNTKFQKCCQYNQSVKPEWCSLEFSCGFTPRGSCGSVTLALLFTFLLMPASSVPIQYLHICLCMSSIPIVSRRKTLFLSWHPQQN